MESHEQFMTRQELAARWGVNAKTIDRLRTSGRLPWLNLAARGKKRPTVRLALHDIRALETAVRQNSTNRLSEFMDIRTALADLIWTLESVFHHDWLFTQQALGIPDGHTEFIHADKTFLEPGVHDESNNWGNRGHLLHAYRECRKFVEELIDVE